MVTVIYDSAFGNTAQVAQTIVDTFRKKNLEATSYKVTEVNSDSIVKSDIIFFGSPTQSFRATKPMQEFIDKLDPANLKNKQIAVFDTRIDVNTIDKGFLRWMVKMGGYADSNLKKKLRRKGAKNIISEGFIVLDREGPLKEGELSRASRWADSILAAQKS